MTINADEYYTLSEYAEVAKIKIRQAWNRAKAGRIPGACKPHGGQWRIPGAALLVFTSVVKKPKPMQKRSALERIAAAV